MCNLLVCLVNYTIVLCETCNATLLCVYPIINVIQMCCLCCFSSGILLTFLYTQCTPLECVIDFMYPQYLMNVDLHSRSKFQIMHTNREELKLYDKYLNLHIFIIFMLYILNGVVINDQKEGDLSDTPIGFG